MRLEINRPDWVIERLGNFAISEKGKKPKNQSKVKTELFKYPYVDIQAFEKNIFESYTDGEKCNFCNEADFLMVWDGSRSGLVGKAVAGAIGSTLVKIRFTIIENHFAYYFLKSKYLEINTKAKGTGTPHVNPDLLWNYSFPIPPLLEQKAIVAKIEQLFSELDNGIANLKAAQAKLKIYRQSVLKKAFSGELTKEWREKQPNLPTAEDLIEQIKQEREEHYKQQLEEWKQAVKDWEENGQQGDKPQKPQRYNPMIDRDNQTGLMHIELPKGWGYYKLGEVYEVFIGSTPSRKEQAYWNGNINWVSSGEVAFNKIMKTAETISDLGLKNASTHLHPIGTVLLAMIGEGKTRGQAGVLAIEACHNQNTAALRVNPKYLSSQLLYNFFYYTYQETRRIGSGNNQKALNKSIISNMLIPLMSFEEQKQIVQEIESRLSVCDKIEETIEAALTKSEALRQSILKKAFEGRLLSEAELENIRNHPNYESAHELLVRIKQEKSQASQTSLLKKTSKPKVSTDIHAGLIAKIIKVHQDNDYMEKLSHVKCEKIAHLIEYHLGVALGREPVKDAAGPDDYPHLKKVEHRAIKAGYFTIDPKSIGYSYLAGRNIDKAIRRFEESIDVPQNNKVNDLINLFLKFDLQSSEIVATLYAAWNNLLLAEKSPNDEEIVYEARENWSSQKLNIDRDRFFKALQWMRQKDISLVPRGVGLMVAKH